MIATRASAAISLLVVVTLLAHFANADDKGHQKGRGGGFGGGFGGGKFGKVLNCTKLEKPTTIDTLKTGLEKCQKKVEEDEAKEFREMIVKKFEEKLKDEKDYDKVLGTMIEDAGKGGKFGRGGGKGGRGGGKGGHKGKDDDDDDD